MKVFALPILLALGLVAVDARAGTAPPTEASPPEVAATLIASHASATTPAELIVLYRLQLAAGRYADAEASLDRLEAAYRSSEPRMMLSVAPWRTYARAKAYEASGIEASAALHRAFAELYESLPDAQAVDVAPWYEVDLDAVRTRAAEQEKACAGMALAACPSAAKLISARQSLAAWNDLVPGLKPLLEADTQRRFLVDDQVLIPTPDGAKIAAMIVRPRSAKPAKLTALLNFTIYAKDDWSMQDALKMAGHGYAGVVAYTRGKGRSSDAVVPYVHDGEDAATVIAWLARQPWSDGRVGMFSGSYNGFTQWAAAKHHPPALKAMATHATNAPGIDTPMQGNVFQSFIYYWPFYTTDNKSLDDRAFDDDAHWDGLQRRWYASGKPYRELDKLDGRPNPVFDSWLQHPSYDSFWQRLIPYGREFADIDIPVFVETGYYDGGMVGALYYFQQHLKYRPSADDRMLIGPYHHIAMQTGVLPEVDGYVVDKAALLDLQDVRLQWFEHVLRGAPLPELLSNRVNFEVMGANAWRHVSTLAEMATSERRLYLSGHQQGDRLLFGDAPGQQPPPELVVDFADRHDADFSPPPGTPDTRNALVFTTPALDQSLEVDGLFRGHFQVVANKRDFDLSVNFYELTADGRYLALASYLGRASYMQDRSHRHLLQPGQTQRLEFESQKLTARLLSPGSRIVAVVGVPKRPAVQINYGTGRDVSSESIADAGEPLRLRWSADSYLELGLRENPQMAEGQPTKESR